MSADPRYYKRTIKKINLASNHLQGERRLRIFLPPDYNETQSYPVIYCQDGEQFYNYGRIATYATQLILDEQVEPFIIVGVEVDLATRTSEYSPGGQQFAAYCRFFAEELVPFIDEQFAAYPEPRSRILAGDSLGATVSLHLCMQFPMLFSQLISLSGAFFQPTQDAIKAQADLSSLTLNMLVGLQETTVKTDSGEFDFLTANRDTRELLEHAGAKITYAEEDGGHTWGFWQKHLKNILKQVMTSL